MLKTVIEDIRSGIKTWRFANEAAVRQGLARYFSHELKPGWWLWINLSRADICRVNEMACEIAGLRYGTDLKVNLGE